MHGRCPNSASVQNIYLTHNKATEPQVPYNPQSSRDAASGPDPQTSGRLDKIEDILSVVLRHHGGLWGYKDVKEYMSSSSSLLWFIRSLTSRWTFQSRVSDRAFLTLIAAAAVFGVGGGCTFSNADLSRHNYVDTGTRRAYE